MKKHFTLGKGKYYFNVKSGHSNITIHRGDKKTAVNIFNSYKRVGKEVEWLGKWTGKKFAETTEPEMSSASSN